ncbi:MAG: hypothetical protein JNK85_27870 [Verrucomicrobiales bacterium]|nr:hypothetical protein [Verrucomicrobiales bacterium]
MNVTHACSRITRLLLAPVAAWMLGELATARAQPSITTLRPTAHATVALAWQGGHGPFVIQASQDLVTWSDVLDPVAERATEIPATARRQFLRLIDLDPEGRAAGLFGRLQTEQGEFGDLLGRHRLKTRLWLHQTLEPAHTNTPAIPSMYWRRLLAHLQTHDGQWVTTWSGPLETLGRVSTPTDRRLILDWTNGVAESRRTYRLTVEFPYGINTSRSTPLLASDPTYALQCVYASPQPEFDGGSLVFTTTTTDRVNLVEMDPANVDLEWGRRSYRVAKNGVHVDIRHQDGAPLYQGSPPWILKTLLLDRWLGPSVAGGGSLPAFATDSYYSRTLFPGHHNFIEIILLEPGLDPAIAEEVRESLKERNIRYVYTFKDLAGVTAGGDAEDLRYIGFDGSIRSP